MGGKAPVASGNSIFLPSPPPADDCRNYSSSAPLAPGVLSFRGMLTFAYSARDTAGKTISGVQEALNEDNAINTLMTRGLMVLSIQQKAGGKTLAPRGKVNETDLVLFTRQLARVLQAKADQGGGAVAEAPAELAETPEPAAPAEAAAPADATPATETTNS